MKDVCGLLLLLGSTQAVASSGGVVTNAALGDAFLANGPQASRRQISRYYPDLHITEDDAWTDFDVKHYVQNHWHPGAPLGTTCDRLVRLGSRGDGGKTACMHTRLSSSAPCLVVSVGSHGEASFENDVLALNRSCEVHTLDPAMSPAEEKHSSASHRVFREAFTPSSATLPRYTNRTISLLKIDCDGCEFDALLPWLASTCTEQILVEVRAALRPPLRGGCLDARLLRLDAHLLGARPLLI